MLEECDPLPISALNQLMYCERRCALIHVEGVFEENLYTVEGRLAHESADTPGYETRSGVRAVRALPLYSRCLGLTGKADIVEFSRGAGGETVPCPVDYKRGRRHRWDNDDVQLCAQALCLEEMMDVTVPRGAIFHALSKRRREVEFTPALRRMTVEAVRRVRELVSDGRIPPARLKPQCDGCSLRGTCLPELFEGGAVDAAANRLFETGQE